MIPWWRTTLYFAWSFPLSVAAALGSPPPVRARKVPRALPTSSRGTLPGHLTSRESPPAHRALSVGHLTLAVRRLLLAIHPSSWRNRVRPLPLPRGGR